MKNNIIEYGETLQKIGGGLVQASKDFNFSIDEDVQRYVHASMVYMMTNMEAMNTVIAFYRDMNGMLTFVGSYPTYGKGTGAKEVSTATPNDGIDPLMSEGSLTLSPDGRFLFAVNAGSNSISSFIVSDNGKLILVDVKPSGGTQPNSMGVFGNLLYVSWVIPPINSHPIFRVFA